MAERIVGFVCCLLCAFPIFVVSYFSKGSKEPMGFWAGSEKRLREVLKDVGGFNQEMSRLYAKCSLAFVISGIVCLIYPLAGMVCIGFDCTVGIYIVWRIYKNILLKYSRHFEKDDKIAKGKADSILRK